MDPSSASKSKGEDTIYVGFQKGDYDRSKGRKGRFIKDDPSKYPDKQSYGPFMGVTGGWAGGEVALKSMVVDAAPSIREANLQLMGKEGRPDPEVSLTKPPAPDKEVVYLGYGKEPGDFLRRSAGEKGRVVVVSKEEARIYPAKETIGVFLGATGGFAGGEAGLQQYLQTGELKLRDPKLPGGKKQFSILAFVGLVSFAGVGGSILLTDAFDVGEKLVGTDVKSVASGLAIDDTTRQLLLVAVGILGAAGTLGLLRAAVDWVSEGMAEAKNGFARLAVTVVFGVLVFLAARALILDP